MASNPIDAGTPRKLPKEIYQPGAQLTSEVSFRIAENDCSLFRMITGMRPAANGVTPSDERGHSHKGGDDGAPIPRIIAGCPQNATALWSATASAAGSTAINSDSSIFTPDTHDISFWVPHGINIVNLYICATISYADAGGTGYLETKIGSNVYAVRLTAGGVTWTKKWTGEANGPQTSSVNMTVVPNSWTTLQMNFYNDFGAGSTLSIFGWMIKEATTIT